MSMHHVVGEEDRDLQPAAQRGILQGAIVSPGDRIEGAADIACGQFLGQSLPGHVCADADQAQLADFFLQRHALKQPFDEGRFVVQHSGHLPCQSWNCHRNGDQAEQTPLFHY